MLLALQGINVLMVPEHNVAQELMLQQEAVVVQIVLQDSIHLQMAQVVVALVGPEAIKVQPVKQLVTLVGPEAIKVQPVKQLVVLVGLEHIQKQEQRVVQVVQIGMLNVQHVTKMDVRGVLINLSLKMESVFRQGQHKQIVTLLELIYTLLLQKIIMDKHFV